MIHTGTIGSLFILLALVASAFGAIGTFVLTARRDTRGLMLAVGSAVTFAAAMLAANITMVVALVTHDFSVKYVAQVGSRATPLLFRIVSLWSALEGSILFWGLILGAYVSIYAWSYRQSDARFVPYAIATMLLVGLFFAFLIAGPADPFIVIDPAPSDGPGPNPLLQNHFLMVIHPPILYLGYVGMTVPFGVATGALIAGEFGEHWMAPLRRWTMVGWTFLTCGIIIGAWWAYAVLGWGGYWAWDPVENASFLPWLTATAFVHSTIVQERRHLLKAWTLSLALATFILTILGTFMTRSGVFNSVHSFTQSDIGPTFLVFIGVILAASIVLLSLRSHVLISNGRLQSFLSRDAAFLMNNLLFVALTFTVLLGTLYPLIAEAVRGVKVSVGEPYFNKMALPMGVAILFLMGVGPALPWGQPNARTWRQLAFPLGGAALVVVLCWVMGLNHPWALATYACAAFAAVVTLREMWEPVSARMREKKEGFFTALGHAVSRAQRRMGGYVVHIGVIVVFVAIASSRAYVTRAQATLKEGEALSLSNYSLVFTQMRSGDEGHRRYVAAELDVSGPSSFKLTPRVNYYPRSTDPVGSPAVHDTAAGDLYVSLQAYDPNAKTATLNVWFFPLVSWIWWSIPFFVLGSLISLWPVRSARERSVA
jgi:cytochrome c-type biogenesis protein CcmF